MQGIHVLGCIEASLPDPGDVISAFPAKRTDAVTEKSSVQSDMVDQDAMQSFVDALIDRYDSLHSQNFSVEVSVTDETQDHFSIEPTPSSDVYLSSLNQLSSVDVSVSSDENMLPETEFY